VEHGRYDGEHYGQPDSDDHIHGDGNGYQRLYGDSHDDGYGKPASERYGYADAVHDLPRLQRYDHCYRRRYLFVEYRRDDSDDYGKSDRNNDIYSNCNRH
jgi:hypothetical protein